MLMITVAEQVRPSSSLPPPWLRCTSTSGGRVMEKYVWAHPQLCVKRELRTDLAFAEWDPNFENRLGEEEEAIPLTKR